MEKFHMCLLKKDMEVIKSAQLSYAVPSHPALEANAEAEEGVGHSGRPLGLESPRAEYSRYETVPQGTGYSVLLSTDGTVFRRLRRHLWHSFVFITCWCILMKTELICFSRQVECRRAAAALAT